MLAVGPADGSEAARDWATLEEREKEAAISLQRVTLEEMLNRAQQFEREIAAGALLKPLDRRVREQKLRFNSENEWSAFSKISASTVGPRVAHPARVLLSEVLPEGDAGDEFSIVPVRETHENVLGFLIVDRAYQSRRIPIENVDIKNLEVFGELVALAFKNERLRGRFRDPGRQKEWDQFIRETMHSLTSEVSGARDYSSSLRAAIQRMEDSHLLEEFRMMTASHERALQAASRISDYTRPLGVIEKIDLNVVVKRRVSSEPEISYSNHTSRAHVAGSASRLEECLSNVINNAKAAAQKNRRKPGIVIILDSLKIDRDDFFRLEIRDSAGGISRELADKIQSGDYSTLKGYGDLEGDQKHGLGLQIVKHVIEGHGGRFEIRPQPPEGTSIFLLLPALS